MGKTSHYKQVEAGLTELIGLWIENGNPDMISSDIMPDVLNKFITMDGGSNLICDCEEKCGAPDYSFIDTVISDWYDQPYREILVNGETLRRKVMPVEMGGHFVGIGFPPAEI